MSQEQKVFDIQCESTKKLLLAQALRTPEQDAEYIASIKFSKIDMIAQCLKEDGSVDLNVRDLSQRESEAYNSLRRGRGAIIQELRNERVLSTLSEEKKERAANAFMAGFSLDAIKAKFKAMMRNVFKPSYAEIVAQELRKIR